MKTLYLMRHAKSSWSDPALTDLERPLNPRGLRDAPEMGRRLVARGPLPQRAVSSPARRARDTALAVLEAAGVDTALLEIDERLYFDGIEGWRSVIEDCDDAVDCLLLVGHNPDFSHFVRELSGSLSAGGKADLPTAALARFELTGRWSRLQPSRIRRVELDWPKKRQAMKPVG